jgi:hypothetical protein
MKIILRILALFIAAAVFTTALFVLHLLVQHASDLASVARRPPFIISFAGWALILLLGPFAAVQLWRLRPSGRIATMALLASAVCYYLTGLIFLRSPNAQPGPIILYITCNLAVFILLCFPAARRLCAGQQT